MSHHRSTFELAPREPATDKTRVQLTAPPPLHDHEAANEFPSGAAAAAWTEGPKASPGPSSLTVRRQGTPQLFFVDELAASRGE